MRDMHVNTTSKKRGRRPALIGLALAASLLVASCGSDDSSTDTTAAPADTTATTDTTAATSDTTAATTDTTAGGTATTAGGTTAPSGDLAAIEDECKAEGQVNLIALPDEWANYKGILASFGEKYPDVKHPVASPEISSQEEMDAVQTLAGQDDMPDSVDVGPAVAQSMVDAGLFEPYTATVDADIPDGLKDPDHNWYAGYYGVIAISTNTSIVPNAPKTFADLKKPEYKGLVSLNDDPRKAASAFAGVMAASLANGGSADDIMPGIEFFAELKQSGNFAVGNVTPATVLSGETPIAIDWNYTVPALKKQLEDAGLTVESHFPTDGVYGGFYAQGVVKDSPHPACSKLWLEYLLSDDGALGYVQGGAIPARYQALVDAGKVTEADKVNMPPDDLIAQIKFLTPAQIAKANDVLQENWGPMVADA